MTDDISIRAGIDSFLIYEEETTFKTKPASITKPLGLITNFTPSIRRNTTRRRGVRNTLPAAATESTARDPFKILTGNFDADVSIEGEPLNFRHLKLVMGSESGAGTTLDPYFYPQETASTEAEKLKYTRLPSFTASTNYYFDGTGDAANAAVNLLGSKVNSYTLRATSGEPITFSLGVPFADGSKGTIEPGVALSNVDPYYFSDSIVEIPTGTSFDKVIENFELSITNNTTPRHGLGSEKAQKMVPGERDISLSITFDSEGTGQLDDFLADTVPEIASLTLRFERTDGSYLEAILLRVKPQEHSMPNNYPDPVQENTTWIPEVVYFKEVTA